MKQFIYKYYINIYEVYKLYMSKEKIIYIKISIYIKNFSYLKVNDFIYSY